MIMKEKIYSAPVLDICFVEIEQGFAASEVKGVAFDTNDFSDTDL